MLINFGEQISPKLELLELKRFCSCWFIYFVFSIKRHLRTVSEGFVESLSVQKTPSPHCALPARPLTPHQGLEPTFILVKEKEKKIYQSIL